jgi:hypothetical protein
MKDLMQHKRLIKKCRELKRVCTGLDLVLDPVDRVCRVVPATSACIEGSIAAASSRSSSVFVGFGSSEGLACSRRCGGVGVRVLGAGGDMPTAAWDTTVIDKERLKHTHTSGVRPISGMLL